MSAGRPDLALLGITHDCLNYRTLAGCRPDGELASYQAQALLHAHHSQAFRPCRRIKADACIFNLKSDAPCLSRQGYGDLLGISMLHGII